MSNEIFRKKSIDKVKSPEQLGDYIRVSTPGIWLVLAAIIILLVGICVWGVFGRLDTKVATAGTCAAGTMSCYVGDSDIQKIKSGMTIAVGGKEYAIAAIGDQAVKAGAELSEHLIYLGEFEVDDWVYEITVMTDLPDGDYNAEIVVESISPMSFVIN